MRRVLQSDKVDVVFAGFSSASREAYRPIVNQFDGLAFYNNQYEGGVCDANMIVTGAVPEQQFSTLIPWMMEEYGPNVYTHRRRLQFRPDLGRMGAPDRRGERRHDGRRGIHPARRFAVLADDPEHPGLRGGFRRDAARRRRAGLLLRTGHPRPMSACRWHPRSMSGRATSTSALPRQAWPTCMSQRTTSKRSTRLPPSDFVERFHAMFPDEPYINQEAANSYIAMNLYKQMVERAGTTDHDADPRGSRRRRRLLRRTVGQCLP